MKTNFNDIYCKINKTAKVTSNTKTETKNIHRGKELFDVPFALEPKTDNFFFFFLCFNLALNTGEEYPQIGQPWEKYFSSPEKPQAGQRILAKNLPQPGQTFLSRLTSVLQLSQKKRGFFICFLVNNFKFLTETQRTQR